MMRQRTPGPLGLLIGLGALLWPALGRAADVTIQVEGGASVPWTFWIIGGLTVAGAVATITRRNPVAAAICLVGTLCCSAGLFLLLNASFMAAIQILVYAGAIMVLFVLVVMSVERPEGEELGILRGTVTKIAGVVAVILLLIPIVTVLMGPEVRGPAALPEGYGTVTAVGLVLFTEHLFPFEAISLLLLAAIVGAVAVTRRRARSEDEASAGKPAPAGREH